MLRVKVRANSQRAAEGKHQFQSHEARGRFADGILQVSVAGNVDTNAVTWTNASAIILSSIGITLGSSAL
jgi:hypothetical protein